MATDILEKAKDHYSYAKDGWKDIYTKAESDLHFLSDEPYSQWDQQEAANRTTIGRPALQIDQLGQFIHQVTNDIRMNTPTINVIPAGGGGDIETAEIISGRIKAIEYKSNADSAYDMAADFSVKSSIGFIRVDHGFSGTGFEQELQIKRVINPQAILIDPDSTEPDGSDGRFGFVFDTISVKKFKEKYPDASPVSFGEEKANKQPQDTDSIVIAEYFYIEDGEEEIGLLDDGTTEIVKDGVKYARTRKIAKPTVYRCWLSGEDVLVEPSKFPGKYIPIVPVYGEEQWIDGKRNLYSLIRKSKSAQTMYNLWKSLETELLIKQQQAPVQAAVGQMRGFEDDWKTPDKAMVLYYHQTDVNGQSAPPPERLQPPVIPTGIVNAARETVDDIKATMGMYNASIGARSNETSGVAIQRRQQEGDVATFHFSDNLVRSITQVGKIIVCALPEIEDTQRVVQIIGKEDEIKQVGINGAMVPDQKKTYSFKGDWDVRVVTGASFTTQRQEAAAYYADLVGKMPDLMPVIGDLVFKYQDSPGAAAISSRLKKLVEPKLLDPSERDKPEEGQPDPQLQQMTEEANQVMQAAQAEIQGLQQELMRMQQETQTAELKRQQDAIKDEIANLKQAEKMAKLEIENQMKDLKLQQMETVQQPQEAAPAQYMEDEMGMSEEALAAQLESVRQQRLTKEQQMIEEQARIAAEREREAQREIMEAQQRQMLIEGIANVQQALGSLVEAVNRPKTIVFDASGNPIGTK